MCIYIEHSDILSIMLEQTVRGKIIKNDDKMLDLFNYAIGFIKCFT